MTKQIKEGIIEVNQEVVKPVERQELNLKRFFDDMSLIGKQTRTANNKPNFHYGDASVTNYLLWLVLGELIMLNDKVTKTI